MFFCERQGNPRKGEECTRGVIGTWVGPTVCRRKVYTLPLLYTSIFCCSVSLLVKETRATTSFPFAMYNRRNFRYLYKVSTCLKI